MVWVSQSDSSITLRTVPRRSGWETSINAMGVSHDKVASQVGVAEHLNGSVTPKRPTNGELRTREYLTEPEVERLIRATKHGGRYAQRDATLVLIAFRHGLRASEIAGLEWSQVEWGRNPTLHVRRAKKGTPAAHPIPGDAQASTS